MSDIITLSVGGEEFSGWTSIKLNRSMEALTGSFEFIFTDKTNRIANLDWPVRPQDECIVKIGNDKILTGYVDKVTPTITKDSHSIKVYGRDKTSDLVDCSYIETKSSFAKKTMYTLAKTLCEPFNINVKLDPSVDDTKIFQFTVNQNDSIFNNLKKKANDLGMLLITNAKGELVITNAGTNSFDDSLEYGYNILSANISYDYVDRFSQYIMNSQSLYKQGKSSWGTNIKVKASAVDEGVKRYRPKLFKASSPLSRAMAQDKVNWEALIRAAKSQTVNVTVQGFRLRDNKTLWGINNLISVYIPPLYINPAIELLISGIEFTIDNFGSFTKLVLKRPDAYTSKPEKTIKASSLSLGWDKLKAKFNDVASEVVEEIF